MEIKIKCNNCQSKIKKEIFDLYKGKEYSTVCTNPKCRKPIVVIIPKTAKSDITIITEKKTMFVENASLIVFFEDQNSVRIDLELGKYLVGRNCSKKKADIAIKTGDKYLSRQHFKLDVMEDHLGNMEVAIMDNTSGNGTRLNNENLESDNEYFLKNGDSIYAGMTTFKYMINQD